MRQVVGDVPLGGSPFPPIADYAFLSDCEACALVAPSGNVEWLCLPRFDGPSIFGAMLDRDAGPFQLAPGRHDGARRPPLPAGHDGPRDDVGHAHRLDHRARRPARSARGTTTEDRSNTHRRSPTDYDADHVLLRTMRCVNGYVEMHMDASPCSTTAASASTGSTTAPATTRPSADDRATTTSTLHLTTDLRLGFEGGARPRAHDAARRRHRVRRAVVDRARAAAHATTRPTTRLVFTADFWHEWLSRGEFPDHPWRPYLQRSALTLKGLTYAPTGAMVAAATTSLPETPGGERNWDYRYTWIRDSTFMLWGLYTLGFD